MICGACAAMLIALYFLYGPYEQLEQAGRDWLVTNRMARGVARDPRIVFLAIDEATRQLDSVFSEDIAKSPTLQLIKQGFPWNRKVYADVVDRLAAAGAKAIIFDMVFPSEREGDDAFRAALERHRNLVVIGSNLVTQGQEDVGASIATDTLQDVLPSTSLLPGNNAQDPRVGFVNFHQDPDGVTRRVVYRTTLGDFFGSPKPGIHEELLSLSAAGLKQAGFADRIPPCHRPMMIRFAEKFEPRSLHEIFIDANWNAPPLNGGALFRDKIVLIGSMAQSSEDRLMTPSGLTFGCYLHLNAINAALAGEFLKESPTSTNLAMILAGSGLAWLLGAFVRRPFLRLLLLVFAAGAFVEMAHLLADDSGLLLNLAGPLIALLASGITWSAWEQILDRIERQRTRRTLERYVGHDVAREVLDNPQTYFNALGGVRRQITALFSDVRGFTTFTETADPQLLVTQLNEYFGKMVDIVFSHQGTLDKFIGDAVMATWGSIFERDPAVDAANAVKAALEMRTALAALNFDWEQRGIREWKIGIGINHGESIAGNIGAEGKFVRFDLTVVGDAINLASRLEGVTKEYGIDLCIGENVAALVRDQFILRSVDLIIVKGKTQPVEIFTVIDIAGSPVPAWLGRHEEAVRLYRGGDFSEAEKAWREVLSAAPDDGIAETFVARCLELKKQAPETAWTGVYEMTRK
jgi:adenylate cyclase